MSDTLWPTPTRGGAHPARNALTMPCNHPLPAWRPRAANENGKMPPTFVFHQADTSQKLELPCGRCIGCRLEHSRQWAMRLVQEARMHAHNHFLTLTYDDQHLPANYSLRPEDFVLFMKRLRKTHPGVRYFQAGEYGEHTSRPHHHAILFNLPLDDLRSLPRARDAHTLYHSESVQKVWKQGDVTIGEVTFESASYVASYVTKKVTGPLAEQHYKGRVPEYATMSRRPGIGRSYYDTYRQELIDHDNVIVRNLPMTPPKYYTRRLEQEDPDAFALVKHRRLTQPQRTYTHRQRLAREQNVLSKRGLTTRGNL